MMTAAAVMTAVMTATVMTAVVMFAAAVVASMRVAAVMMPTVPALAAAKTEAAAEFVAHDVPAGPIPAIVVPTVALALEAVFFVPAFNWRHAATAEFDLQPRPTLASLDGNEPPQLTGATRRRRCLAQMDVIWALVGIEKFAIALEREPWPAVRVGNQFPQLAGAVIEIRVCIHL
jgi:hypothetical protein